MAVSTEEGIRIAIELFRASKESSTSDGKATLVALDNAAKHGKIITAKLPMGLVGQTNGKTIEMNEDEMRDLAKTSIWLVHEGYHYAVANAGLLEIDEEITSRELQAQYTQTLMRGITFEGVMYRASSSNVLEYYLKDTLVDWVLGMPPYSDQEGFLTQRWVIQHIDDWKGPRNRNIFTKQKYAAVLVQRPELIEIGPGARALFAILSSGSASDARGLITHLGGGNFDKGRGLVRERIGKALFGSAGTQFGDRIQQWQKETGVDLGIAK